jgi:2-hydroxy-6-oxonona-2,4-dienedioate hydrolase
MSATPGQVLQYPLGVGELTTRVLECGTGDDIVVCLHGSGSRADRWLPVLPLLASCGFHAYAVDYPGHGLAAKPAGYPYGTPAFARFAAGFVDQLGAASVALVGTSIGGHVAATVARDHPHLVRATILVGAVGLVAIPPEQRPATNPIVRTGPDGIRAKLEFLLWDRGLITDEWILEESRINSSPGAAEALAFLGRYSADQLGSDLVGEAYAALGIPTMLCWGADDRWVPPAVAHATSRLLPEAPLLFLEDAGHSPYFERPVPFVEEVALFLGDPASIPAGPYSR